jgi:hypothetical protein
MADEWMLQDSAATTTPTGRFAVVTEDDEVLASLVPALASGAGWVARRLPTVSAQASVRVPAGVDDATALLEQALRGLDASFTREPAPGGQARLAGALGSGALKMNPTVFGAIVRPLPSGAGSAIALHAAAKEGLVKQHSAQKLIDRITRALETETDG